MKLSAVFGKNFLLICLILLTVSCATYYQKRLAFARDYHNGDYEAANKFLDKDKKGQRTKNRLLFLMNKGVVEQQLGHFATSNKYFEEAYRFIDNYRKNIAIKALSLISNSTVKTYSGEDFEVIMIHYYKALNYIFIQQYDAALVECKRMNIRLNELNDKYKNKNKYHRDAFIQNLMGIIYEARGEHNDAFIAYRNAYETYEEDYKKHFNLGAPEQLKKDLLRSANNSGLYSELEWFENKFKTAYKKDKSTNGQGEIVSFWNNGLGPIKAEWSINFSIIKGSGGYVTFANEELGLNFPFYLNSNSNNGSSLSDLKFIRVAFPKYQERKPVISKAELVVNNQRLPFEKAEDITAIAFQTLKDRMLREMSTSLLRLALKQAAEEALRKQNEGVGAAVSLFNAITEKADTRNWQTLPYHISYNRVSVDAGETLIEMNGFSGMIKSYTDKRNLTVQKGQTYFQLFTTVK